MEKATFTRCEAEFCAPAGGTLATVDSSTINDFLWNLLLMNEIRFAFIGIYHPGKAKSGNWTWVDGSGTLFSAWNAGELNDGCAEEDCAVMMPVPHSLPGWDVVSCNILAHCLCQLGGQASEGYTYAENNLIGTGGPQYGRCGKGRECFWIGSGKEHATFQHIFVITGFPSILVLLCSMQGRLCRNNHIERERWPDEDELPATRSLHYGLIVKQDGEADVDSVINDWIWWGVFWSMAYAGALLALAATSALRYQGFEVNIALDAGEAFVMFASQLGVGFCVRTVRLHLSPAAQSVAGKWVLVLALSKFSMAGGALVLASIYLTLADGLRSAESFCQLGYTFCWSMLLSMLFQCSACVAMSRISERALSHMGDRTAVSKMVGCWWAALIFSTFAVGFFLWCSGAMFVFDYRGNAVNPFKLVPTFFMLAATSQFIASFALRQVNVRVRKYFGSPEGQMVAAEMNAALSESE